MFCPECGIVVGPGPMRAHELSDDAEVCSGGAALPIVPDARLTPTSKSNPQRPSRRRDKD